MSSFLTPSRALSSLLGISPNSLPLTDERMTRFWITLDESAKFVLNSLKLMKGGEIFIPKIPSYNILDLVKAITPKSKINLINVNFSRLSPLYRGILR